MTESKTKLQAYLQKNLHPEELLLNIGNNYQLRISDQQICSKSSESIFSNLNLLAQSQKFIFIDLQNESQAEGTLNEIIHYIKEEKIDMQFSSFSINFKSFLNEENETFLSEFLNNPFFSNYLKIISFRSLNFLSEILNNENIEDVTQANSLIEKTFKQLENSFFAALSKIENKDETNFESKVKKIEEELKKLLQEENVTIFNITEKISQRENQIKNFIEEIEFQISQLGENDIEYEKEEMQNKIDLFKKKFKFIESKNFVSKTNNDDIIDNENFLPFEKILKQTNLTQSQTNMRNSNLFFIQSIHYDSPKNSLSQFEGQQKRKEFSSQIKRSFSDEEPKQKNVKENTVLIKIFQTVLETEKDLSISDEVQQAVFNKIQDDKNLIKSQKNIIINQKKEIDNLKTLYQNVEGNLKNQQQKILQKIQQEEFELWQSFLKQLEKKSEKEGLAESLINLKKVLNNEVLDSVVSLNQVQKQYQGVLSQYILEKIQVLFVDQEFQIKFSQQKLQLISNKIKNLKNKFTNKENFCQKCQQKTQEINDLKEELELLQLKNNNLKMQITNVEDIKNKMEEDLAESNFHKSALEKRLSLREVNDEIEMSSSKTEEKQNFSQRENSQLIFSNDYEGYQKGVKRLESVEEELTSNQNSCESNEIEVFNLKKKKKKCFKIQKIYSFNNFDRMDFFKKESNDYGDFKKQISKSTIFNQDDIFQEIQKSKEKMKQKKTRSVSLPRLPLRREENKKLSKLEKLVKIGGNFEQIQFYILALEKAKRKINKFSENLNKIKSIVKNLKNNPETKTLDSFLKEKLSIFKQDPEKPELDYQLNYSADEIKQSIDTIQRQQKISIQKRESLNKSQKIIQLKEQNLQLEEKLKIIVEEKNQLIEILSESMEKAYNLIKNDIGEVEELNISKLVQLLEIIELKLQKQEEEILSSNQKLKSEQMENEIPKLENQTIEAKLREDKENKKIEDQGYAEQVFNELIEKLVILVQEIFYSFNNVEGFVYKILNYENFNKIMSEVEKQNMENEIIYAKDSSLKLNQIIAFLKEKLEKFVKSIEFLAEQKQKQLDKFSDENNELKMTLKQFKEQNEMLQTLVKNEKEERSDIEEKDTKKQLEQENEEKNEEFENTKWNNLWEKILENLINYSKILDEIEPTNEINKLKNYFQKSIDIIEGKEEENKEESMNLSQNLQKYQNRTENEKKQGDNERIIDLENQVNQKDNNFIR